MSSQSNPGVVINLASCHTFILAFAIGVALSCSIFAPVFLSDANNSLKAQTAAECNNFKQKLVELSADYVAGAAATDVALRVESKSLAIQQGITEIHSKLSTLGTGGEFTFPGLPRCTRNPFLAFISQEKFNEFEEWALKQRLQTPRLIRELSSVHRDRWEQFIPVIPGSCDGHVVRLGRPGDGGKLVCGLDQMDDTNCMIFSLGSNNDWSFEEDLLGRKKGCKTITFDCTGNWTPPASIIDRAAFRKVCFGVKNSEDRKLTFRNIATMMTENDVTQLNFLKMDIENGEWAYFADMFANTKLEQSSHLPDQIVVEVHWMADFNGVHTTIEMLANLVDGWYDLGYRIVDREMNPTGCNSCYEITIVRFRC